ncbi:MAG: carboxypeptidase regulatory-like domain-containing protein [Planctomycetota bacterium]|jgi:protocatechuate 3,4-dioxygenase beta subunit
MKGPDKLVLPILLVLGIALAFLTIFLITEDEKTADSSDAATRAKEATQTDQSVEPAEVHDETVEGTAAREIIEPSGRIPSEGGAAPSSGTVVFGIVGRLLSETGEPLVGGEVTFRENRNVTNIDPDSTLDVLTCRSEEDGRFILRGAPEIEGAELHFFHPDCVPHNRTISYFDGRHEDVGDIFLASSGRLSGRVFDPEGKPMQAATVWANPITEKRQILLHPSTLKHDYPEWKTVTNWEGRYNIQGLPGGTAILVATHPEHAPVALLDVTIRTGTETMGADLALKPASTITGRVLDSLENPLEGVKINANAYKYPEIEFDPLSHHHGNLMALSDESGTFELKGVKDVKYRLRASAKGFLKKEVLDVEPGTQGLLITLSRGGFLYGRIVDGETLTGIEDFDLKVPQKHYKSIKRILKGKAAADKFPFPVDPKGAYYADGLPTGTYRITVSAKGYGYIQVVDLEVREGEGLAKNVALWPESRVSGFVLTSSDQPVEGAHLRMRRRIDKGHVQKADSRSDGSFVLDGLPPGDFTISVSHPDHVAPEKVALSLKQGEKLEGLIIRMEVKGSITGRAFDISGNPKPRAEVVAVSTIMDNSKEVVTDEEGRFLIDGLLPEEYFVHFSKDIRPLGNGARNDAIYKMRRRNRVLVEAGSITTFNLHEKLTAKIEGRVYEDGLPAAKKKVSLAIPGSSPDSVVNIAWEKTDEFGAYAFEGLVQGHYWVILSPRGFQDDLSKDLGVNWGETGIVNFELTSPKGRVKGRVLDGHTGRPFHQARVWLKKYKEGKPYPIERDKTKSDEAGFYEFTRLPEGRYSVYAVAKDHAESRPMIIDVTEGADTTVQDIHITRGYNVSGSIIDGSSGRKIHKTLGVRCYELEEGEECRYFNCYSPDVGRFKTQYLLAPGRYRLKLRDETSFSDTLDFTLGEEDIDDIEFVVYPR